MGTVNERVALRPVIYNSNGPVINVSANSLELRRIIAMMFYKGEQGFFYDPSDLKTQYRDAAGTTAVNATGQPLGLLLDKSKGLMLGPERIDGGDFTNGLIGRLTEGSGSVSTWEINNTSPISGISDGKLTVTTPAAFRPFLAFDANAPRETGSAYTVSFDYKVISGSPVVALVAAGGVSAAINKTLSGSGRFTYTYVSINSAASEVIYFSGAEAYSLQIDNVSCKQVLGNHAYQTTSAARPILQQTPILGNELVASGGFSNGTVYSFENFTTSNGGFSGKTTTNKIGGVVSNNVLNVTAGVTYVIAFDLISSLDGRALNVRLVNNTSGAGSGGNSGINTSKLGKNIISYTPSVSGPFYLQFNNGGSFISDYRVENISMKEITGYRTDQNYIEYDGIDDKLITNLPAQLNNCTVLRAIPDVGTQVKYNQTLPMLYEDSAKHAGLVAINRALTRQEQLRLMNELDKRAGATSLETLTFKAFDNNQEGFVFDPNDLSTVYQDSFGIVPVTGAGQPVGLILDKSKGLKLGANIATTTTIIGAGIGGAAVKSNVVSSTAVIGKRYKVSYRVANYTGTNNVGVGGSSFGSLLTNATLLTANGTVSFIAEALATTLTLFTRDANNADFLDITIQELQGNHAYQANSASRPILRQNAVTGAYYLEFDGVDDYLETSAFACPVPFSTMIGLTSGTLASTRAVLSGGTGGYLYTSGAGTTLNLQQTSTPFGINKNVTDTVFHRSDSSGVTLKSSLEDVTRNDVASNNPYAVKAAKFIGKYSAASTAHTAMHIYAIILIGKALTSSEEAELRKHLNKRMGVSLS